MCRLCADIKEYSCRVHLFYTIIFQQILYFSNRTLQECCLPSHKVHMCIPRMYKLRNTLKKPLYRIPLQTLTRERLTTETLMVEALAKRCQKYEAQYNNTCNCVLYTQKKTSLQNPLPSTHGRKAHSR